ncbi:MAG: hypothetical protein GOV02_01725 [Candidatus Aenigmarchaeota archaeon]|nr:hypothetical protein [Candidatus Aenigmarchaeota archaeon]
MKNDTKLNLENMAIKILGIETLETRHSDELDFHELAVWKINELIEAAYNAGKESLTSSQR